MKNTPKIKNLPPEIKYKKNLTLLREAALRSQHKDRSSSSGSWRAICNNTVKEKFSNEN